MKHLVFALAALGLFASPAFAQSASQIDRVERGASCAGCDLLQIDLSFQTVTNRDFSRARLMQGGFTGGVYDGTVFRGANLRFLDGAGSRFERVSFEDANLENASLVGSEFGNARFNRANLTNANFSGSDLLLARGLTQAQLNAACGDSGTLLPEGMTIPLCQ
jgi:uncharacterized protein YjbI with pentapeptide repeats